MTTPRDQPRQHESVFRPRIWFTTPCRDGQGVWLSFLAGPRVTDLNCVGWFGTEEAAVGYIEQEFHCS